MALPNDEDLVRLYYARDERALNETQNKHGRLIFKICKNILGNDEDAKEVCNSVYYTAWTRIPPERPRSLTAFLCHIARSLSINKQREKKRLKRRADDQSLSLDEAAELSAPSLEEQIASRELSGILNGFLGKLPEEDRRLFVRRYYFEESAEEIARCQKVSRKTVYNRLEKIRNALYETLKKEGYLP